MEHLQEIRVLYSDTDAYGVVWHGSYTKWFEAGRVGFVEQLGLPLEKLESDDILFPVVELNIRYKSSARMNERIIVSTKIHELKPLSVTFEHKVYEKSTNTLRVTAYSTIVVTNAKTGKMYRRIPEEIYKEFEKAAGDCCAVR